jgi:hypothetical protein
MLNMKEEVKCGKLLCTKTALICQYNMYKQDVRFTINLFQ